MAPSLLITGTTGYVGGDFLYAVTQKHPDWNITAIVRNAIKGAKLSQEYPKVRLVFGDLDSSEILEQEASQVDVVLHFANCTHKASATALLKGLARSSKPRVFYIHTSGTGILTTETFDKDAHGEMLSRVFNDWEGIEELWSLPDRALYRPVDKIVQASWTDKVKSAIVCPPTIYGKGRGPDNQRSVQAYKATESMLRHKKGWVVGSGNNVWHQVHIHDLSDLYIHLTEAAVNGGPPATWNDQGYYLAEAGEFIWGDVLSAIAKNAHSKGFIPSATVEGLSPEQIKPILPGLHYAVGTNARGISKRGKQLFGWKPHRPSLLEEVPTIVDSEASRLGLLNGNAVRAQEQKIFLA